MTIQAGVLPGQPMPSGGAQRQSFALEEIILIQDYFKGEGARHLVQMDAMERRIPPLYLRRSVVGKSLPVEIRPYAAALPADLNRKLPRSAAGRQRVLLGRRVLLLSGPQLVLSDSLVIGAPASGASKAGKKSK